MVRKQNQAAKVWDGQGWLAELGYKDAEDLLAALTDLANLPMSVKQNEQEAKRLVEAYLKKWPDFLEFGFLYVDEPYSILELRDRLRLVWQGSDDEGRTLLALLTISERDQSYDWEGNLDKTYEGSYAALPDWHRREFVYRPKTPFQAACYLLLKNSHLTKVCANPDCPRQRFFIADRALRRYCSAECFKPFQEQRSLDWWNRVGKHRRAAKMKAKRKGRR